MPNPQIHLEQAEHNESAASSVRQDYPDWAVTMYFYAALHWIERYALLKGCNIARDYDSGRSKHDSRQQYINQIARDLNNPSLRKAYQNLELDSRKARYLISLNTKAQTYYSQPRVINCYKNLQTVKNLLQ
jgi:radical SAM superfamily enzyme